MRNKNFILGIAFVLSVTLLAILGVYLWNPSTEPVEQTDPFGDTSALRTSTSTDQGRGVFGDVRELLGTTDTAAPAPFLRLVVDSPVSGAGFATHGGEQKTTFIRYVEKNSGNLFETPLQTVGDHVTLSDKTLLRVAHALWSPNGASSLILRLNETSDTVFAYLGLLSTDASSTSVTMKGRPLPNNVASAAFSADNTSVAYLLHSGAGSKIVIENIATGARRDVWSTPLTDITIQWDSTDLIAYPNPTDQGVGVLWKIDPVHGGSQILVGNEYALAGKLSRDGTKLLYSFQEQGGVTTLRVRDLKSSETTYLPSATIVEKCTWDQQSAVYVYCAVPRTPISKGFVEEVYRGTLQTDDILWRFNVTTGEATQLVDLYEQLKVRLDAEKLLVSGDGSHLIFQTRDNDYLWALALPAQAQ